MVVVQPRPAERILSVALHAFATYGYEGVSVRTLNRELAPYHLSVQRYRSKERLWRAAVDYGFRDLDQHLAAAFEPALADPLEQLRGWIRRSVRFWAGHPELLSLVSFEARRETERLAYLYDGYLAPALGPVGTLLEALVAAGRIRPIALSTFHAIVVHGAAGPPALGALSARLDPGSAPDLDQHAEHVAAMVMAGLRR
ncbi:MAG TPA: TetR/AcrR family transcriptional regulator [Baekduia sp.]|jgi:AcrR family transcriptional regulator